jgi:hypothetical protein
MVALTVRARSPFVVLVASLGTASIAHAQPLPALPATSATAPAEPPPPPPEAPGAPPAAAAPYPPVPPPPPPPPVGAPPILLEPPPDDGCPGRSRIQCHDGFYLRMALGFAGSSFSGNGPLGSASTSGGGLALRLGIGGTVGKGVVLGATLFVAGASAASSTSGLGGVDGGVGGLNFLVDWYPSPEKGWHVGGDIGVGAVALTQNAGSGGDLMASIFGGYDWWIADQWSFGVMVAASGGSEASIADSNGNDTGYRLKPGSIALLASFLYH